MKTKISRSKGQMYVDYLKVLEKTQFRYRLLKAIVENFENNAILLVDTNQGTHKCPGPDILERLRLLDYEPLAIKIPAGKEQFFGIKVSTRGKNEIEYVICLELKGNSLTQELFDELSTCDIAVGIGQIEPITNQYGLAGIDAMLILKACFEKRIYDSMLCSRINSNFDISSFVEEITHEMGL